ADRSRDHDRLWFDRKRRASHEARRLRLRHQTVSRGRAEADPAAHGREGAPGRGESISSRARAHRIGAERDCGLLAEDPERAAPGYAAERYNYSGADYRRKRHR